MTQVFYERERDTPFRFLHYSRGGFLWRVQVNTEKL